jgi:hypothetical protein
MCDLNIMGTRMEASVHLFQNRGMTQLHHRGGDTHGKEVLIGTFFLNGHPIIVLFNSRASHDFMSTTSTRKAKLSLVALEAPYVISTP